MSNGHEWRLVGTKETQPWLNEFSRIMELKRAVTPNGNSRMIFMKSCELKSGNDSIAEVIKMSNELPEFDGLCLNGWRCHDLKAVKLWYHDEFNDVICEMCDEDCHEIDIIMMWQVLRPIYSSVKKFGGIPLHAALLEWNGHGIMIAAPGDTGKSTCSRRVPFPWKALCDDEALIVRDTHGKYMAHPFPTWSEYIFKRSNKTWNVERYVPVSAIFFLEQSITDEVIEIGDGEAAALINEYAVYVCRRNWRNMEREDEILLKKRVFENSCELAGVVPSYRLKASLTGRFWEKIEEVSGLKERSLKI